MFWKPSGLWTHPDFRRLWAGQTISRFGSHIGEQALRFTAIYVLQASRRAAGVARHLRDRAKLCLRPAGRCMGRPPAPAATADRVGHRSRCSAVRDSRAVSVGAIGHQLVVPGRGANRHADDPVRHGVPGVCTH